MSQVLVLDRVPTAELQKALHIDLVARNLNPAVLLSI